VFIFLEQTLNQKIFILLEFISNYIRAKLSSSIGLTTEILKLD
jgi:hypothetical protein